MLNRNIDIKLVVLVIIFIFGLFFYNGNNFVLAEMCPGVAGGGGCNFQSSGAGGIAVTKCCPAPYETVCLTQLNGRYWYECRGKYEQFPYCQNISSVKDCPDGSRISLSGYQLVCNNSGSYTCLAGSDCSCHRLTLGWGKNCEEAGYTHDSPPLACGGGPSCFENGQTCVSNSNCCSNSCLLFSGVGYRCTPGSPPFPNGSFCTQNNQCTGGYCCNQACQNTSCPIENCSNNIDDDADGLIDCQDYDCPSGCASCQSAACNQTTYDWSCNPITSCINNDGCCPLGCNSGNDNNCSGSPGCFVNGLSCAWNSDCCSAYCRPDAPRVCSDPPPIPSCSIRIMSCPSVCVSEKTFNVSYDYKNTDHLTKPNISQRIVDWNYNNLWCLADQAVNNNAWHSVTRTVPCPSTSMTVFIGGHSDSNHWTSWCSVPWINAGIANGFGCIASCQIEVIPPAIGLVKIKHLLGILKLRLISFIDAKLALKGILKVARFNGDTNASADLVETNDPNASPVRVKTPFGIKAWRMQR